MTPKSVSAPAASHNPGGTSFAAGVAGSLREVTSVMESLARFKRWSQVIAVPELGLTGLLAAVTDERLVDYSRRHLGPLIKHDTTRKGNLVATLRAYLETGEQQEAAQRLRSLSPIHYRAAERPAPR